MFWKLLRIHSKHKKESYVGVLSEDVFKILQNSQKKYLCSGLFFNKALGWKPETIRNSHWRCSVKECVLTNFANHLCWSLFLIKLPFWGPATLLKKTPIQMLSCEIWKTAILKNIFLWETASKIFLKRDSNTDVLMEILRII